MYQQLAFRARSLLHLAINVLYPLSRRERRVASLSFSRFPLAPLVTYKNSVAITTLCEYGAFDVRDLIWALKYRGSTHAASILAHALITFLIDDALEHSGFIAPRRIVFVAVPLGSKRQKERGFNQVMLIITEAMKLIPDASCDTSLLRRTRETRPQTSLGKHERRENTRGAFVANSERAHQHEGSRILLIDDVTTTGATLAHASHALCAAGIPHECIAIARA